MAVRKTAEERLLRCWGKTAPAGAGFHPAVFHMLDAGHVAHELLDGAGSPRWRGTMAHVLAAKPESLAAWLPWLVALHDIGKLSAAFQRSNETQKGRLLAEGFCFGAWRDSLQIYHADIGAAFVADTGVAPAALPSALRSVWCQVVGGHHGRFLPPGGRLDWVRASLDSYEPPTWRELRTEAAQWLGSHLGVAPTGAWRDAPDQSAAIMALCGFTSLCDWIASDSTLFPPCAGAGCTEYAKRSIERARRAVEVAGFAQPVESTAPSRFTALFADLSPPRPLQEAIDAIPQALCSEPCLAIIEAPTGEGKTEAALALAHRLARAGGTDELYYALPTTATSNQMFARLQQHLRDRLQLSTQAKLVHGQAFLVEDDLRIEPLVGGDAEDARSALEWFRPKKRALLAPFAVGTVDQVELAALVVRYGALRMAGLAGKVLILDEVHAYDAYMTTIVERLLEWLAALGTSVILLSATLPASRREALMRAYGAPAGAMASQRASYPSLWAGNRTRSYHATPVAWQSSQPLSLGYLQLGEHEAEAKACWLLDAVAGGGCACWIANTVPRAQEIYGCLRRRVPADTDPLLLHSRFPLEDRRRLEDRVVRRYGPAGQRPQRGIVIGTQVLEQSLDLDFDVMVSDLAPVDLLLQRAGRLHRHSRERPPSHRAPRLWINVPQHAAGAIDVDVDRRIYAEYILRQTWVALAGRKGLDLPADYRRLIEAVYDGGEPPPGSPLRPSWQRLQDEQANAIKKAELRLWPEPDRDWPFCASTARLTYEEDENSAAWIVARTRLGEESVTVIPLERNGTWARLYPTTEAVSLERPAPRNVECRLMRRSLRISHRSAVHALKHEREELPALFARSALLKGCFPLWLTDGQARLSLKDGCLALRLDAELGLVIERQGG